MRIHNKTMRPSDFQEILDKHDRVALAGAVESGKSLLLDETKPGRDVLYTDKVRETVSFGAVAETVVQGLDGVPRFVVSGMVAPLALLRGLEVDVAVWLDQSRNPDNGPSHGLRAVVEKWEVSHPDVSVYFVERALHEGEAA